MITEEPDEPLKQADVNGSTIDYTPKTIKERIKNNVTWEIDKPKPTGGQQCGMRQIRPILVSEDMSIKIEVAYYRNQFENRELAMTLFELALDELIK